MFGLFRKESPREKLEKKYKKMLEEAYQLSHRDRSAADKMQAEAEKLWKEIEQMKPR
jgi:hypothetical protein